MRIFKAKYVIGLGFIAAGAVIMGKNFGVDFLSNIDIWYVVNLIWPLFIVAIGVELIPKSKLPVKLIGMFIILIGASLFVNNMGIWNIDLSFIWNNMFAILIIIFGLIIISSSVSTKGSGGKQAIGSSITIDSKTFRPEKHDYEVLFGSIKMDLENHRFERDYEMKLSAVLGSMEIILPRDVNVRFTGSATLGGVKIRGKSYSGIYSPIDHKIEVEGSTKTLVIDANAVFGEIDFY